MDKGGDAPGLVPRRAEGDLERSRDRIEERGGGWRGDVPAS